MTVKKVFITCAVFLSAAVAVSWWWPLAAENTNAPPPAVTQLILYDWQEDIPSQVLEAFTRETGIIIDFQTFASQEEAVDQLRSGKVCDVAVIEGRFLPVLIREGYLHRLKFENLSNFKYISPNFRNLSYDPDNLHSIPYSWGTTGILVNRALAGGTVRRWGDFWNDRFQGQVALSISYPREAIGMTLKSLGYSANSENPREIEAAFSKMQQLHLAPDSLHIQYPEFGPAMMQTNAVALAIGFSGDYQESRKQGLPVDYVLPEEGLLLWSDNFTVPTSSRQPAVAELFINYLLRPEVSAAIVNEKYYASANEAAQPLVNSDILADSAIYPSDAMLANAEIINALSPAGQALVDDAWKRFLTWASDKP